MTQRTTAHRNGIFRSIETHKYQNASAILVFILSQSSANHFGGASINTTGGFDGLLRSPKTSMFASDLSELQLIDVDDYGSEYLDNMR